MSNIKNKKMKLIPSIFKKTPQQQQPPWQWLPSCNQPRTLSFRNDNNVFKTVNSVFLDIESPESLFTTTSSQSPSFSTEDHLSQENEDPSLDSIIQQIQSSDRLFFEPLDTSSILIKDGTNATTTNTRNNVEEKVLLAPFKQSVALAMESEDPYSDFKKSMAEMVETHGLKDWDCLEELLSWYLKMNGKVNHGFIVGAFVDLLVGIDQDDDDQTLNGHKCCVIADLKNGNTNASCSITTSYSSAASTLSSPPCSPISSEIEIDGGSCCD